jgi:hypothetical protein
MSLILDTFALNTIEHLSNNFLFYKLIKTILLEFEYSIEPMTSFNVSNTFPTILRYNLYCFYSVIINTRVAKQFTTSLGQFQAL